MSPISRGIVRGVIVSDAICCRASFRDIRCVQVAISIAPFSSVIGTSTKLKVSMCGVSPSAAHHNPIDLRPLHRPSRRGRSIVRQHQRKTPARNNSPQRASGGNGDRGRDSGDQHSFSGRFVALAPAGIDKSAVKVPLQYTEPLVVQFGDCLFAVPHICTMHGRVVGGEIEIGRNRLRPDEAGDVRPESGTTFT